MPLYKGATNANQKRIKGVVKVSLSLTFSSSIQLVNCFLAFCSFTTFVTHRVLTIFSWFSLPILALLNAECIRPSPRAKPASIGTFSTSTMDETCLCNRPYTVSTFSRMSSSSSFVLSTAMSVPPNTLKYSNACSRSSNLFFA